MCNPHYMKWYRFGDPLKTVQRGHKPRPAGDRFWEKVNKDGLVPQHRPDLGGCWVWTATRDAKGYGHFKVAGQRIIKAHRWSYEDSVGPIPGELELDHLCRNTSCVNPVHLEAVTRMENMRRHWEFRRGTTSESPPPDDVTEKPSGES